MNHFAITKATRQVKKKKKSNWDYSGKYCDCDITHDEHLYQINTISYIWRTRFAFAFPGHLCSTTALYYDALLTYILTSSKILQLLAVWILQLTILQF